MGHPAIPALRTRPSGRSECVRPLSILAATAVALAALFTAPASYAKVTILTVTGASQRDTLSTTVGSTNEVIYGGAVGASNVGPDLTVYPGVNSCASPDNINPCNNCQDSVALNACNERRIYPALPLVIEFSSDTVDGLPVIADKDGNGITQQSPITSVVTKGTTTTVTVLWQNICSEISNNADTDCGSSNTNYNESVLVGIDKDGNGRLSTAEGDEFATVTVRLQRTVGSVASGPSVHNNCASAESNSGICYFELVPGDTKAYVSTVEHPSGFPLSSNGIKFRTVRFYYVDAATGSAETITPLSSHADLLIEEDTEVNRIHLNPNRIGGLTNDRTYVFSVATIDAAGNIGFFTPNATTAADPTTTGITFACADPTLDVNNDGTPDPDHCRTVTPGEVVGVLGDKAACFIATASYGSSMAPQVQTFRAFRDRFLMTSEKGRGFIRLYYKYGPHFANVIVESPTLRTISRAALWPAWVFAWGALQFGAMNTVLLLATFLLLPFLAWKTFSAKRNKITKALS